MLSCVPFSNNVKSLCKIKAPFFYKFTVMLGNVEKTMHILVAFSKLLH